jgi:hypothetical protein
MNPLEVMGYLGDVEMLVGIASTLVFRHRKVLKHKSFSRWVKQESTKSKQTLRLIYLADGRLRR